MKSSKRILKLIAQKIVAALTGHALRGYLCELTDERMIDDPCSAIAIVIACVLTDDAFGMIDASTTRSALTP
ncbi:hypothetical protein NKI54_30275 [Mesorhizobium sp. M0663]